MRDQAEKLRQLMKTKIAKEVPNPENKTRILTITSGKGGVGKTSLTVNLAIVLQDMGYRVLIVDADLGLGNVDIMLDISPEYNLSHIIFNQIDIYDVIIKGPSDIMILPGGSGLLELANLQPPEIDRLIRELIKLSNMTDIILIDTGAGLSTQNIKMILAAGEAILVTTPDPTSLMDAYGMVKVVSSIDNKVKFNLMMNMVDDIDDAYIAMKNFQKAGKQFLNVEILKLGLIENSPTISKSIRAQSPFILEYPYNKASKQLRNIARELVNENNKKEDMSIMSYINKLFGLFKKN